MGRTGSPDAKRARELADVFCRQSRRRVEKLFRDMWRNDDEEMYRLAVAVLDGEHQWLESNVVGLEALIQRIEAGYEARTRQRETAAAS